MARIVRHGRGLAAVESDGVVLKDAMDFRLEGDAIHPVVWVKLPLDEYLDSRFKKEDDG